MGPKTDLWDTDGPFQIFSLPPRESTGPRAVRTSLERSVARLWPIFRFYHEICKLQGRCWALIMVCCGPLMGRFGPSRLRNRTPEGTVTLSKKHVKNNKLKCSGPTTGQLGATNVTFQTFSLSPRESTGPRSVRTSLEVCSSSVAFF